MQINIADINQGFSNKTLFFFHDSQSRWQFKFLGLWSDAIEVFFIDFTIIAKNQEHSVGGMEWEHDENICGLKRLHIQTSAPAGTVVNRTVQGDAWSCMRDGLHRGYWNEVDQTLVFLHAIFTPYIKQELAEECSGKDFVATGHTLYSRNG